MTTEPTILILDDEANVLTFLEKLFKNEPYGIVTAGNHRDALGILKHEPSIKVVMSDQRMPDILGMDFLNTVKDQYPDKIRMLFTAHDDIQVAEAAINEGEVYRFILKPWNTGDLKGAFKHAIERYDLIQAHEEYLKATETKNKELAFLNARLKNMYERQKDFTSTVSHELKTPLASIKSTVDLVLSEDPGPLNPDQTKFLKKTQKNVDRLNHLIADILDLTRLESGKSQIRLSPQPLHTIIQEVMDQHMTMAEAKGLFLKTDCSEAMPAVMCDPEKIHQVLWNLIDNAVKFTVSGGIKVSCRVQPEDNLYRVSVRDTGPGIPPEDQERIFEKFEQLGDATQHASGTGLGLALCQEIITRHQGTLWVESSKQKGSCFCFTLPMQS